MPVVATSDSTDLGRRAVELEEAARRLGEAALTPLLLYLASHGVHPSRYRLRPDWPRNGSGPIANSK